MSQRHRVSVFSGVNCVPQGRGGTRGVLSPCACPEFALLTFQSVVPLVSPVLCRINAVVSVKPWAEGLREVQRICDFQCVSLESSALVMWRRLFLYW